MYEELSLLALLQTTLFRGPKNGVDGTEDTAVGCGGTFTMDAVLGVQQTRQYCVSRTPCTVARGGTLIVAKNISIG
jgi:hypothetical protein